MCSVAGHMAQRQEGTTMQPSPINRPQRKRTMEERPAIYVAAPIIVTVLGVCAVCWGLPNLLAWWL